ncbi:MAG: hypothetical protein WDA15_05490, partial [Trueperaceae bacterium]
MLEENVVSQAGAKHQTTPETEIVRQIVEAGYKPAQRDSLYGIVKEPERVLAEYEAALQAARDASAADAANPVRVGASPSPAGASAD